MSIAYLNGEFLPIEEAKISVMDRGFLFGDGVYEVIPVYHNKMFRAQEHMARLQASLAAIMLDFDLKKFPWQTIFAELIQRNPVAAEQEQSIYLQITRGAYPVRTHSFKEPLHPTVFARISPIAKHSLEDLSKGLSVTTMPDIRWQFCHIKSVNLLPNVLSVRKAELAGYQDVILIHQGNVIEAASSNVFIVKDGVLITPPLNERMLGGITRSLVLELAAARQIPYRETEISEAELEDADEIWLSGSTREIVPVLQLNGKAIGNGQPGPLWQRMIQIYFDYKKNLRH